MWCGGVWHIGTNILEESGTFIISLRRKNSCTLKRGAVGSSKLFESTYQTTWSHIPWLYSQQTSVPITHYMPWFNIHEHQGRWTALKISQKICSFSPHRTHCDVPPPPLWTCAAIRVYSCCVFRCHINRRIRVKIMLTSSKEIELFIT